MNRHAFTLLFAGWISVTGITGNTEAVDCDDQGICLGLSRGMQSNARWSVEADSSLWWTRGTHVPALVSTSDGGTPREDAGVLGLPSTEVLFGGDAFGANVRAGARVRIARRLDDDGTSSAFLRAIYLGSDGSGEYQSSGADTPILARPFWNAETGSEDSQLVAYPGVVEGSVEVGSFSELLGGDLGLERVIFRSEVNRIAVFSGYRFLRFREGLSIREDLTSVESPSVIPQGTEFMIRDDFGTDSRFHGGTIGLRVDRTLKQWELTALASVSLGGTHRRLRISGHSDVTVPGDPTNTTAGGLLALPSNIGQYRSSRFAAVPEWQIGIRRRLSDFASVGIGYDLILLPEVWRIGDQIDRRVNESQIGGGTLAGEPRPAPRLASQTMWLQGITFSMRLDW